MMPELAELEALTIRTRAARDRWSYEAEALNVRTEAAIARRPPLPQMAASLGEIICRPEQHVWLGIPRTWLCQCGMFIIEDTPHGR